MSEWAIGTYGNPCRECGFDWALSRDELISVVSAVPGQIRTLVAGYESSLRPPDLGWSIGSYVCHVADNLRIYAERVGGIVAGSRDPLAPYDQDALAEARQYWRVPLPSSLWSLDRSAQDWCETAALVNDNATVVHPERGQQTALDLMLSSAHDAVHHIWDIRRSIEANR